MKQHIKEQHSEKKNLKYPHCDHISHTKATIYLHVKCCPKNPNRIPLYCELCIKGPWYTGSKLLEHKWKDHKWKCTFCQLTRHHLDIVFTLFVASFYKVHIVLCEHLPSIIQSSFYHNSNIVSLARSLAATASTNIIETAHVFV